MLVARQAVEDPVDGSVRSPARALRGGVRVAAAIEDGRVLGSQAGVPAPLNDDTSGNMNSGGTFAASYNDRNQTTSMNGLSGEANIGLTYFGTNEFERASAGSKSFVTNTLGVGSEKTGTSTTYYRRDSDGGLASERLPSGAIYYYAFDGLGSVTAVTDSPGGTVQDTYSYEPYGVTGISGTVPNPWQFASGYHDSTNWWQVRHALLRGEAGALVAARSEGAADRPGAGGSVRVRR